MKKTIFILLFLLAGCTAEPIEDVSGNFTCNDSACEVEGLTEEVLMIIQAQDLNTCKTYVNRQSDEQLLVIKDSSNYQLDTVNDTQYEGVSNLYISSGGEDNTLYYLTSDVDQQLEPMLDDITPLPCSLAGVNIDMRADE